MNDDEIKSLREWLAHWPDDKHWADDTGQAVPIAKVTLKALLDERDMWKRRAAQHGCNIDEGDHECG